MVYPSTSREGTREPCAFHLRANKGNCETECHGRNWWQLARQQLAQHENCEPDSISCGYIVTYEGIPFKRKAVEKFWMKGEADPLFTIGEGHPRRITYRGQEVEGMCSSCKAKKAQTHFSCMGRECHILQVLKVRVWLRTFRTYIFLNVFRSPVRIESMLASGRKTLCNIRLLSSLGIGDLKKQSSVGVNLTVSSQAARPTARVLTSPGSQEQGRWEQRNHRIRR